MAERPGCSCFIVPPALLERIAREGTPEQREAALRALSVDHTIRGARLQRASGRLERGRETRALFEPTAGRPERTIFDAGHRNLRRATKVLRSEGEPPVPDRAADEAYDGLGLTYELYWRAFGRDSIDDAGMPLLGEVHFGRDYPNAFWDGERMIFGDGDGRLFTGFTGAVDVIGHELTHGVIQDTLSLQYLGQAGAVNESISDVMGSLVKQHALGQRAEEADWLVGAGILGPLLEGVALRSLKAPGTAFAGDPQPAEMSGYVATAEDYGGVHTNSGIPNHAFYLAATAIGGFAWERAGRIWYETLVEREVPPRAGFHAFAEATLRSARRLFGHASPEAEAVAEAWARVGVLRPRLHAAS
jgi:Zn-dependent metalloprotease